MREDGGGEQEYEGMDPGNEEGKGNTEGWRRIGNVRGWSQEREGMEANREREGMEEGM